MTLFNVVRACFKLTLFKPLHYSRPSVHKMMLNFRNGNLVVLPGRAYLLLLVFALGLVLPACQKKEENEAYSPTGRAGLEQYAEQVGASSEELYKFNQSLSSLQKADGSSSTHCLNKLHVQNSETRNSFLACMSLKGLSGLNKEFLEELVGVRLSLMEHVHNSEASKTLRLLNWIFDLTLEQYALSNPKSYWLTKGQDGKMRFTESEMKSHDDFHYQEGDLILSISPTELSTLIPQYSYPQRRLTHSMLFRGKRGHRKEHFIESEFEEGVRYKYRDIYRNKDNPYETITLRYVDPSLSLDKLRELRRNATDFAASQIGIKYGFTTNAKDGYACHLLTGLSFTEAAYGNVSPFLKGETPKDRMGFEDLKKVLTSGFSPMRQGLSRSFSTKFGMAESIYEYPTAGDFLTSKSFEVVAVFIRPDLSKKFSDYYTIAETVVDSLDRGSVMSIDAEQRKNIEPLLRDRYKLSELIGMARKLKRHTLFRESMSDANVSVERLDEMTVTQLKEVLDRLDEERKVLIKAARDEIGLNILGNAFGKALNLKKKSEEKVEKYFSLGDFLLVVQGIREESILEFNEYVHTLSIGEHAHYADKLASLKKSLEKVKANMETRRFSVSKVTDEEFEELRSGIVKINFREIDTQSDHKEIDKLINRVIVGFNDQDFDQLQLFIDNLDFEDFKKILNFGEPLTYQTFHAPSRPAMDPNYRPMTYTNSKHFVTKLPVLGTAITRIQNKLDAETLTKPELNELETYLRVYARFLMSIPSLKKKLTEYDGRDKELQDIIKNTPYIASALSDDTLIEFGLYKKVASGVVEKLDEIREGYGVTQLRQMPPWIKRSWMEYILSQVPVMRYVPSN